MSESNFKLNYLPIESLRKLRDNKYEQNTRKKALQAEAKAEKDEVSLLRKKYSDILRQAVIDDDASRDGELLHLDEKIKEAESRLKIAEGKLEESRKIKSGVTAQEVVNEFNNTFNPKYRADVLNPVLQKMEDVKKQAEEVAEEYRKVVDKHEEKKKEIIDEIGESYQYKLKEINLKTQEERERFFPTQKWLKEIERKVR